MFYRAVVAPKKPAVFVPPPEEHMLHLSQAALPHDCKEGTRASLLVRFDPSEAPAVLCTLTAGRLDTVALDQFFSHYCEFSVAGNTTIHISGYYAPQHEEDEGGMLGEDEDEDEDEDFPHPMDRMMMNADGTFGSDEDEDEDDDSEDDEDEDSDELRTALGWGAPGGKRREPSAVIEEIEDDGDAPAGKLKALPAPKGGKAAAGQQQQQGKKQQQQEEESDSEEDEDEDDEGEEDDSEDDEGEESEESEEEQPQAKAKAGDKRKAAADATPVAKKQAVAPGKQQQQAAAKTPQPQQKTPQPQQKTPQQQPAAAATPKGAAAAATPGGGRTPKPRVFENGFEIHDLKMGQPDGRLARAGKRVSMRYVGRLKKNGKVFDSNTKGKPFSFRLGVGEVIKGWDRGVEGMRVGDKRKLVIPPQMAYGSQSLPGIPPSSTLEFEVELVDVK